MSEESPQEFAEDFPEQSETASEITPEQLMAYIDAAHLFRRTLVGHGCSPAIAHQLLALCGIHVDLGRVMDCCNAITDRELKRQKLDLYRRIYEAGE